MKTKNWLIAGAVVLGGVIAGISLIPGTGDKMLIAKKRIQALFKVSPKIENGKVVSSCYHLEFVSGKNSGKMDDAIAAAEEYYFLPMIALWAASTPAEMEPSEYVANAILSDLFPQCVNVIDNEDHGSGWDILYFAVENEIKKLMRGK